MPKKPAAPRYRVVVGINYAGKRAEPDDVVDDVPASALAWMLPEGILIPLED